MKTRAILYVPFLAAVALIVWAGAAFAKTKAPTPQTGNEKASERTLTVAGSGKVYMTPDIAYVTIGVHTEDPVAKTAVADNNEQTQEVIDTLKDLGIDAKDIQTTNFSIYPQQEYDSEGKPTGELKYVVDNSVLVTVRDLELVGSVLDQAVLAGANNINGIQFDLADRTAAQSVARKAAVANAEAKAQELAEAAGVTLGQVQTISEFTSGAPVPMYDMRASAPVASSVPVEAGQMALTIEVNIVYQIQ
jgi:uncharacterized protein YggE